MPPIGPENPYSRCVASHSVRQTSKPTEEMLHLCFVAQVALLLGTFRHWMAKSWLRCSVKVSSTASMSASSFRPTNWCSSVAPLLVFSWIVCTDVQAKMALKHFRYRSCPVEDRVPGSSAKLIIGAHPPGTLQIFVVITRSETVKSQSAVFATLAFLSETLSNNFRLAACSDSLAQVFFRPPPALRRPSETAVVAAPAGRALELHHASTSNTRSRRQTNPG